MVPIYVRITVGGQRVEIALKHYVTPTDWNAGKGLARGSKHESKALNHYLGEGRTNLMT